MCVEIKSVMVVGINRRSDALRKLPVRVFAMETGDQAVCKLKMGGVNAFISPWELAGLPNGTLLKRVKQAKPDTPTVAFISPGDTNQERAARGLGVDVVLGEDISDEYFIEAVRQILCITELTAGNQQAIHPSAP